jgi:hypothetical protein
MTDALFRRDAYAASCDAAVTHVTDDGVELDRTVFYPHGGGQAGDSGWLVTGDGTRLRVTDARKSRREGATPDDTVHVIEPSDAAARLLPGTPVRADGGQPDNRGKKPPAHRRGACLGEVPEHGSTQLLLGWPGRETEVVRGHPGRRAPSVSAG